MGEARRARTAGIEPSPKDRHAWRVAERKLSEAAEVTKDLIVPPPAIASVGGKRFTAPRQLKKLMARAIAEWEQAKAKGRTTDDFETWLKAKAAKNEKAAQ